MPVWHIHYLLRSWYSPKFIELGEYFKRDYEFVKMGLLWRLHSTTSDNNSSEKPPYRYVPKPELRRQDRIEDRLDAVPVSKYCGCCERIMSRMNRFWEDKRTQNMFSDQNQLPDNTNPPIYKL